MNKSRLKFNTACITAVMLVLLCWLIFVAVKEKPKAEEIQSSYTVTAKEEFKHYAAYGSHYASDYEESIVSDTGIKLYTQMQSSSLTADNIKFAANNFFVDFTQGKVNYPLLQDYWMVTFMDYKYRFDILNADNETAWYAEYIGITGSSKGSVFYMHSVDVNGRTQSSGSSTDIKNAQADLSEFGVSQVELEDGEYKIKISRNYNWEQSSDRVEKYETFSTAYASLTIDTSAPVITALGCTTGKKYEGSINYVNEQIRITASDVNFENICYQGPGDNGYEVIRNNQFVIPAEQGAHNLYATDAYGNATGYYNYIYDTVPPHGKITSGGQDFESGGCFSDDFTYSASDTTSSVDKIYMKSPHDTSFQAYKSKFITVNSKMEEGLYSFYALDKSGNISETITAFLETSAPEVTIHRNGNGVYAKTVKSADTYETNLYFNAGDTFKIDCRTTSGGAYCDYSLGQETVIGNDFDKDFNVTVTSATGLRAVFKLHVAKIMPKLIVDGSEFEDGETLYRNNDTVISWSIDTAWNGSNIKITSSGNKVIDQTIFFASGQKTFTTYTDEGTETFYQMAITDAAENVSRFTMVLDKKAPSGVIKSDGRTLENGGFTNKPACVEFYEEGVTAQYSVNGGEYKPYTSGQLFTADAAYVVLLTDRANNKTSYTVTVDTVAPSGQLYADYSSVENGAITNKKIYFSWDGELSCTVNGVPYAKNTVLSDDAEYTFVLTDYAGNASTYRITVDTVCPSFNADRLAGDASCKISKWYVATIGGADYSFATHAEALTFASGREFESGVTVLNLDNVKDFTQSHLVASNGDPNNHADEVRTGEYWLYRSKANPNIKLYYFDRELLNEVLAYYAKENVSGVNYYVLDGDNLYGTPSDSMRDNVLTAPNGTLAPAGNGFVFERRDSAEVYAELVGGDGTRSKVAFGTAFGQQFFVDGLYKITEFDEAKNETVYYLYLDFRAPELKVLAAIYGNAEPTELTITKDSLAGIAAYYYESFDVRAIADADKWSVLTVKSNGKTNYYTFGDELPLLNVGGEYLLWLYDRFGNAYSFTVYIVGNPAEIEFGNNGDDTAFTLTITLEQDFDTIVALEIRRNGVLLSNVTTDALTYTFDKGGVYTVSLRDNFGRVIEKEYTFVKALPAGTLAGAENGGKTKTDVTFTYDADKYYAVVYKDGAKVLTDRSGSVFILANDENCGDYIVRLINLTDEENYTEYRFIMNTLAPYIALSGVNNDGTTNSEVTVSWTADDVASAVYTINGSAAKPLTSGQVLTVEGCYSVTVMNDLGTVTTLNFTIDRTLDYTVFVGEETISSVDATNQTVAIVNNEPLHISVLKNGEPIEYAFGSVLSDEGVYSIRIFDGYGNAAKFIVTIDKSVSYSANIANGLISNGGVSFVNGEKLTVTVTRNNKVIDYAFEQTLDEEGLYTVTLRDVYGNEKTVAFRIVKGLKQAIDYTLGDGATVISVTKNGEPYAPNGNRLKFAEDGVYVVTAAVEGVTYTFSLTLDTAAPTVNLNGVENGGVADGVVTITEPNEEATIEVYKNGERVDYEFGQELTEYGDYRVVVTDSAGNVSEYSFTLKHLLNGGAAFLIIVFCIVLLGAALAIFILRRKGVFGKSSKKKDL